MQTERQTNLLKFLRLSRQRKNRIEKICMPQQTYGVSKQSPVEFQQEHTLVSPLGYKYEHDLPRNSFSEGIPFSQRVFFTIENNKPSVEFKAEMSQALTANPAVFHRRKGLLSEYMDKNGWMSKVHKLSGKQRSVEARALANKDRDERIKNFRKSPNSVEFQTIAILQKPVDKTYFEGIPALMGEKMRIRRNRNRYTSQLHSRKKEEEAVQAQSFKIDNFGKRQLSQEMDQRAQTSRSYYKERLTVRTSDSSPFKRTTGFNSTRNTFRLGATRQGLDFNENNREETDLSEFDAYKLKRTGKVIPDFFK